MPYYDSVCQINLLYDIKVLFYDLIHIDIEQVLLSEVPPIGRLCKSINIIVHNLVDSVHSVVDYVSLFVLYVGESDYYLYKLVAVQVTIG